MKNIIIGGVIFFAVALDPQITQAQGTVYISNLSQPSAGSDTVGNDSWLAYGFRTGTNAGGYMLNSVQLAMTDASGNPSGFTALIYSATMGHGEFFPSSSIGSLSGSTDPVTAGIFIYTPVSSLMLSSATAYFIVLTAGTIVANGAYEWSLTGTVPISYNSSGGWDAPLGFAAGDNYKSSNGLSWSEPGGYTQFAIDATATPEPGVLSLLVLGGLGLLWQRRRP